MPIFGGLIGSATVFGLAFGLAFGLTVAPVNLSESPSPISVLRRDRSTFLLTTFVIALVSVLVLVLVFGVGHPHERVPTIVGVATFGLALGLGIGMSQTPWGMFALTRAWLAMRGRLPFRLVAFLADAHQRGVLRQVGAVYQFRHIELQRRLANR
jgi:hypothetical protein